MTKFFEEGNFKKHNVQSVALLPLTAFSQLYVDSNRKLWKIGSFVMKRAWATIVWRQDHAEKDIVEDIGTIQEKTHDLHWEQHSILKGSHLWNENSPKNR